MEALKQGDFFPYTSLIYFIYLLKKYKLNKKTCKNYFCFCITLVAFQSDSAHFQLEQP